MNFRLIDRRLLRVACSLIALSVTFGCVKFTPRYDDTLDKSVTSFQQSVETYLTKLEGLQSPDCTYDKNKHFYDQARVQLATMKTRIAASPHPGQLTTIVGSLSNTLDDLQELQQTQQTKPNPCLNSAAIEDSRQAFEREFESMLAYELALKANQPPTAPTKQ